jgi:hypothetical protein
MTGADRDAGHEVLRPAGTIALWHEARTHVDSAPVEFVLVLPVPGSSYRDLDEFRVLEDHVSEAIGETGRVDRHDAGAGETDFLILTQKPLEAYDALRAFGDFDARPELRAAYLHTEDNDYEVYQRDSTFRFHIA